MTAAFGKAGAWANPTFGSAAAAALIPNIRNTSRRVQPSERDSDMVIAPGLEAKAHVSTAAANPATEPGFS